MSGYVSLTSVSVKNNFTCQKKVGFFFSKVGSAFWLELEPLFFNPPNLNITGKP